jgi:hypothetical protein
MGYIGLLLNAPYKRDRMMGCVCGYRSYTVLYLSYLFLQLAKGTQGKKRV